MREQKPKAFDYLAHDLLACLMARPEDDEQVAELDDDRQFVANWMRSLCDTAAERRALAANWRRWGRGLGRKDDDSIKPV